MTDESDNDIFITQNTFKAEESDGSDGSDNFLDVNCTSDVLDMYLDIFDEAKPNMGNSSDISDNELTQAVTEAEIFQSLRTEEIRKCSLDLAIAPNDVENAMEQAIDVRDMREELGPYMLDAYNVQQSTATQGKFYQVKKSDTPFHVKFVKRLTNNLT